jgi:tRNA pseudouridine55 synthase
MIKKGTNSLSGYDFHSGEIMLLDKPLNWTSFDVVNKVRRALGVKKVGHSGTLDPMATGLLIVCSGRKTKEIIAYQNLNKTYTGSIMLGKRSKSMDFETELTGDADISSISDEQILNCRRKFMGQILQVPPIFSAIKIKGKSLYNTARKGKTISLQPREINIINFNITSINRPNVNFEITCSKGTYIRAIANDFGEELGCGGVLSSLRRTAIGDYSVDDSLAINDFISLVKEWKKSTKHDIAESVQHI